MQAEVQDTDLHRQPTTAAPEYLKIQYGKRWLLVRPIIGALNAYKAIAAFDAECELDKLLEPKTLRAVK